MQIQGNDLDTTPSRIGPWLDSMAWRSGLRLIEILLWCWAGAMALDWYFADRSVLATMLGLVGSSLLLVIPALHLPFVRNASPGRSRILRQSLTILTVSAPMAVLGAHVWPHTATLHQLSQAERDGFEAQLKTILLPRSPMPDVVRLECPSNKPKVCANAAQFVDILKEAHWRTELDEVKQVQPLKPVSGVGIVYAGYSRGTMWKSFSVTPTTLVNAFSSIGVTAELIPIPDMQKGVVELYFGPDSY
jgi:hypothetical protein